MAGILSLFCCFSPATFFSVSDHFTQVLHCEHECVRDLATRPGRLSPMENYLPLHYDYLQFAYFQSKLHFLVQFRCIRNVSIHQQLKNCDYKQWCHSAADHTLLGVTLDEALSVCFSFMVYPVNGRASGMFPPLCSSVGL